MARVYDQLYSVKCLLSKLNHALFSLQKQVGWFNHRVVKPAQEAAAQFILQPQFTDNPQNILRTSVKESLQMHFKVAVKNSLLLMQEGDSLTDVLKVVSVLQL